MLASLGLGSNASYRKFRIYDSKFFKSGFSEGDNRIFFMSLVDTR